jgi:hypothetical protein
VTTAELACNDEGTGLVNGASAIQVKMVTGDKLTLVVDSKAGPSPNRDRLVTRGPPRSDKVARQSRYSASSRASEYSGKASISAVTCKGSLPG